MCARVSLNPAAVDRVSPDWAFRSNACATHPCGSRKIPLQDTYIRLLYGIVSPAPISVLFQGVLLGAENTAWDFPLSHVMRLCSAVCRILNSFLKMILLAVSFSFYLTFTFPSQDVGEPLST